MHEETGVAAVNGARIHYATAGSGPPVVFIHGFGLDHRMWDDQVPAFSARYRVIRYDVRSSNT